MEDLFGLESRIGLQFPKIGTEYTGKVLSFKQEEQKDMATGETKTWNNGEPMMQVVVELEIPGIEEKGKYNRDADSWEPVEDDPGTRYMFCKGGLFTAMRNALKAAGKKIEVGGTIHVKFTSVGKASQAGWSAPKRYEITYTPPVEEDVFAV